MPIDPLRRELVRVCEASPEWDRRVAVLQVTEAGERAMQLRALVSAADACRTWDLRCRVREALVGYVQRDYPELLPRVRADIRVAPVRAEGEDDDPVLGSVSDPRIGGAGPMGL